MFQMRLIKTLMIGVSSALLSVAASAAVVFENGTNGDFWGGNNPFTYQEVTNSFALQSDAVLTSLTYNAFTTQNTVPVTNALVNFYENNSGNIGNLLFSQNLNVSSSNVTGSAWGYDLTDFTINLPNFGLNAGNYFLGLHVSPNQWDMHWSIATNPAAGGGFGSDGFAHYFRLEANPASVPEPAGLLLLGLGMFGLAAARARKA
jgi:hypothetical protein